MPEIKLQCRPELLRQWHHDAARNPRAFMTLLALSPDYITMLLHDALAAHQLLGAVAGTPAPVVVDQRWTAPHQVERQAVPGRTTEFTLRAMAFNYGEGPHTWDRLDRDACIAAADEISALRAAATNHDKVPQVAGKFQLRDHQWHQVHPNSSEGEFLYSMREAAPGPGAGEVPHV